MARYNPMQLKSAGTCPICQNALVPGAICYFDNVTRRRLCQTCGDITLDQKAAQEPKPSAKPKAAPVDKSVVDELAKLTSRLQATESIVSTLVNRVVELEEYTDKLKKQPSSPYI